MHLNTKEDEKEFELIYKGNRILVRNEGSFGERFYINSILQDQNTGPYNGKLAGFIHHPDHTAEKVEITLQGAGRGKLECLILINGDLVYSSNRPTVTSNTQFRSGTREKRVKNMTVVFAAVVIALLLLILVFSFSGGHGKVASSEISLETGGASADAGGQSLPELMESNFTWDYKDKKWNYQMKIPKTVYDSYKTVDRGSISSYSDYVTDLSDDEYLAGLVSVFRKAAKEENLSDMDVVKMIVSFVQNLSYLPDKIETGYDEYPKFPLETLADQGGDCEDTAILLASLLRELGYGAVLIQLPNHMAVGVKGSDSFPGTYYDVEGIHYYYIETTSTGWGIGEVPEQITRVPAQILILD